MPIAGVRKMPMRTFQCDGESALVLDFVGISSTVVHVEIEYLSSLGLEKDDWISLRRRLGPVLSLWKQLDEIVLCVLDDS